MRVFFKLILIASALFVALSCHQTKKTTETVQAPNTEDVRKSTVPVGLGLGNRAPDIQEKAPDGTTIALSSIQGKLVLIDFWASWCGPCRLENPAVVKAYQQFKDSEFKGGKGFTIYSVSLDSNGDAWKKAIEKDALTWPYHVSDLKGWNSAPAAKYNVISIPSNFLINDQGIIINKNLRGEDLLKALESLEIRK